jgi:hypothetical protein
MNTSPTVNISGLEQIDVSQAYELVISVFNKFVAND